MDEEVEIIDVNGEPVGTVLLPGTSVEPGETVIVGPGSPEAESAARQLDLGSAVVQITIVDSYGQSAQPTGNIEVCLHVPDTKKAVDDGCLSFFDEERQEWICEDPCLKIEGSTACGTVNHLTKCACPLSVLLTHTSDILQLCSVVYRRWWRQWMWWGRRRRRADLRCCMERWDLCGQLLRGGCGDLPRSRSHRPFVSRTCQQAPWRRIPPHQVTSQQQFQVGNIWHI